MAKDISGDIKNFNHHMWYQEEDGIITIGINEEGLADITEITGIDLPAEQEKIDADIAIGTVDSDDGSLDIFSPVEGTVIEVNANVLDDYSVVQDDPYEEGWLLRIEASAEIEDEDEADDEEDDEDDDLDDDDEVIDEDEE